jgi:hypothetical protein
MTPRAKGKNTHVQFHQSIRCPLPDDPRSSPPIGAGGGSDFTRVALLEKRGQYAGRRVTLFRAFEPGHQDLLLGSGHVEPEGRVVVNNLRTSQESTSPARENANRAGQADDERVVFWDAPAARSSEPTLSGPAATWLYAGTNSEHQR